MQKILTIAEVAERLGLHPVTVYRLVKEARLPVFRIGRMLRFDADQLEKLALIGRLPKRRRRRINRVPIVDNGVKSPRRTKP